MNQGLADETEVGVLHFSFIAILHIMSIELKAKYRILMPSQTVQFGVPCEFRYHRSVVESRYREVIDILASAVESFLPSVVIPSDLKIYDRDMKVINKAFELDYPEIWWTRPTNYSLTNGIVTRVSFQEFDQAEVRLKHATIEQALAKFKAELRPSMSQYEVERCIHDFIVAYCEYSANSSGRSNLHRDHTIYGFFSRQLGVCECYTEVFLYLCINCGIRALKITGLGHNGPHAWNMVRLEDDWYHVDVTWDDPLTPEREQKNHFISHLYMNLSDDYISINHQATSEFGYPRASSMKYNYNVMSGSFISAGLSDHALIESVALACITYLDAGYDQCEFLFDKRIRCEATISMIKENCYNILYYIRQNTDHKIALNSISFTDGRDAFPALGFKFKHDDSIFVCRSIKLSSFNDREQDAMIAAVVAAVDSGKKSVLFTFDDKLSFNATMEKFNGVIFHVLAEAKKRCVSGRFQEGTFNYTTNSDRHAYCLVLSTYS